MSRTTINNGDTGLVARTALNANFTELYPLANAGANAAGARRPTIAIMGDSYGTYLSAAIQWCCAKYYAADIDYDSRTYASGGRALFVGGTSSAQMVSTQITQLQANPADVVFIWTCKNSAPTTLATAASEFANIKSAADAALATGASLVVLFTFCCSGAATVATFAIESLNCYIRDYARANDKIAVVDFAPQMIDPSSSSTSVIPFKGGSGSVGSYSFDNTHPSGTALRVLASTLSTILQRIAGKRLPRASIRGGFFNPTTAPDVNLLGDAGLMIGTSGQNNSVNDANVAGVSSAARWNIIPNAGVTATPSIVTRADGYTAQRITFGGTPTTGAYVIFQCQPTITGVNNSVSTQLYDGEINIDFNGVTGLYDLLLSAPVGGVLTSNWSAGTFNAAHQFPDTYTDSIFLYTLYALTIAGNNPTLRLTFYFATGSTPAGYVDLYRASLQRVAP